VGVDEFSQWPTVRRVDWDLLGSGAYGYTYKYYRYPSFRYDGETGYSYHGRNRRYVLISKSGEELAEVEPSYYTRDKSPFRALRPSTWFLSNTLVKGKTVFETVQNLEDPDDLAVILEISDSRPKEEGGYVAAVVIHKIPSGQKFSEWLATSHTSELERLQTELAEVNVED